MPEPIKQALEKARAEANIMPKSQLKKILKKEYGTNWKQKFSKFDEKPFAAASIGQVHFAETHSGERMAIKIQYPGVAQSIDSDLNNLKNLFNLFKIFPKGLYIDDLIKNLGNELRMECNYIEEAEKQRHFKEMFQEDKYFFVPEVKREFCSNLILASQFVDGDNVDELDDVSQEIRDKVGSKILELCLRELFEFNYMQTDPNPANFFYDRERDRINLIDFGAARRFDKEFVDNYMKIVYSAATNDKETLLEYSKKIGFLNGKENEIMRDSHANATFAVGEPFNINNEEIFDFGNQNLTKRIYKLLPLMLKHRLKAPPTEVYSLHRKLSGAYLICIKLKSRVKSKKMFFDLYDKFYKGRI